MEGERNWAISAVRLMALCMIVLCHLLQHYALSNAEYLATGVQVFLCISGFLYGTKQVNDGVTFFKRGAWKIILDYWVLLLLVIPLFLAAEPGDHTLMSVLGLFAFQYQGFNGLQHTWFLPTILACYLAVPLLQRFAARVNTFSTARFLAETALLFVVLQIVLDNIILGINAAWLFCFMIVYLLSSRKTAGRMRNFRTATIALSVAAVVLNAVKIYINTCLARPVAGTWVYYFHVLLEDYAHATFGVAVFFLSYLVFSAIRLERIKTIGTVLRFTDRYSYDIYLAHYIWIEAPFGVAAMALSPYGDIIVILLGTVLGAMLLHWLSQTVNKLIRNGTKPRLA